MAPRRSQDPERDAGPPHAALIESWRLLRELVDSSHDLIWTMDVDEFRLLTFNRALQQYFAEHHGVTLRCGMTQEELLPEPGRSQWCALYRRALEEGALALEYATIAGERTLDVRLHLLRRGSEPYAISVFGRDITLQKKAEADRARLLEQQVALSARLQRVAEEEKARLSRDLHDELGQLLTGLKLDLVWIEERLEALSASPRVNAVVDRAVAASELVDQVLGHVQRIATELRPAALDRLGLGAAIRQEARRFQARSGIACSVSVAEPFPALPSQASTALYRIVQEALTNVARHARAARVSVRLATDARGVVLSIDDDGIGIDADRARAADALGIAGMRERAEMEGGELVVRRRAEGGTHVAARLPLHPVDEALRP